MTKNELKKLIYKQNPTARFLYIKDNIACYIALLDDPDEVAFNEYGKRAIEFNIPLVDMDKGTFNTLEEAKLLIKWIYYSEEVIIK